jgi:hypothetical protein
MLRLFQVFSLAAVTLFAIGGCSQSGSVPPLGKVTGVVTLDDAPYPNANVIFTPEKGRPSQGLTDSAGRYELTYLPEVKGAEIADHTVSITTQNQAPADGKEVDFKEPLPKKYNENTTLTAKVVSGQNEHNFPLKSK